MVRSRDDDFSNHGAFLILLKVIASRSGMRLGKGLPHPLSGSDLGIWQGMSGIKLISSICFQGGCSKIPRRSVVIFLLPPSAVVPGCPLCRAWAQHQPRSMLHHRQTGQGCPWGHRGFVGAASCCLTAQDTPSPREPHAQPGKSLCVSRTSRP